MNIYQVNTTTDNKNIATNIAELLVNGGLSPCVQICDSIMSIYKWKDKLQRENEYLLTIKVKDKKINDVKRLIMENHNYDTPELIITKSEIVSDGYAQWFSDYYKQ
jgi:periplasmic divalent cation tolerance protein